ncbi:MAG: SUMF1/EgtB/PvdO family nonheme iron enzyme [Myxococcales bacterium]
MDEDLGTQDMVRVSKDALDFWIDVHEASRPSAGSALSCAAAARGPRTLLTGTPHGCPAPAETGCVSAFGVVDMSGNVREWTATQVSDAPQTFRIRGGSAGNIATGVTCQFDFGLAEPAFAFENLGFRCCKDP